MTTRAQPACGRIQDTPGGRPDDSELAAAIAAFTGWRAWRTRDGGLAARKGGSPPPGAHARGSSVTELTHAIEAAIKVGPAPSLRPAEQAVLDVLIAAPAPRRVRAVSDATGLHSNTTAKALAALHERGLAARRRDGHAWLYTCATAASPPGEGQTLDDGGART